jgi:hypothetical protein
MSGYCPFPALIAAFPGLQWRDYTFEQLWGASRRLAMFGPTEAAVFLNGIHRPPEPKSIDEVMAGWQGAPPVSDELKASPLVTGEPNEWWGR